MRRIKFSILLLVCVCVVAGSATGCSTGARILSFLKNEDSAEVTMTEASRGIYQMNLAETKLSKTSYEFTASDPNDLIGQCIEGLAQQPSDKAYKSVIAGDVKVVDYTYDGVNHVAVIYFDPSYKKMTASREILTRAAIVKTLTQFSDEIQYVSFVIGEESLTASDGSLLLMRGRDVVDNISGNMEYVREDYVTMYFVSEDGTKLQAEDVIVKYLSKINLETAVVNSLISGPITKGLRPSLSADITVNKVSVKEGICYVDLDDKFFDRINGQSFSLNVYSIVNTLTHIPGITRVQFLIDGEIFEGSVENMRIDGLFERDMSMVYVPEKNNGDAKDPALNNDIEKELIKNKNSSKASEEVTTETVKKETETGE